MAAHCVVWNWLAQERLLCRCGCFVGVTYKLSCTLCSCVRHRLYSSGEVWLPLEISLQKRLQINSLCPAYRHHGVLSCPFLLEGDWSTEGPSWLAGWLIRSCSVYPCAALCSESALLGGIPFPSAISYRITLEWIPPRGIRSASAPNSLYFVSGCHLQACSHTTLLFFSLAFVFSFLFFFSHPYAKTSLFYY